MPCRGIEQYLARTHNISPTRTDLGRLNLSGAGINSPNDVDVTKSRDLRSHP